jgi:tripartite-type tricarboxylate transporter receptor subunit TctC
VIRPNRRRLLTAAACAPLMSVCAVHAAGPDAPLRVVTAAQPGGGVDLMLRHVAESAARRLGRRALVDNRPGATGLVAARLLAQQPADGHHLGLLSQSLVTLEAMGAPVNLGQDFMPLCRIANVPCVVAVAADAPWRDAGHWLEALSHGRLALTYGSGGVGSGGHLSVELMAEALGRTSRLTHVPYRSLTEALLAIRRSEIAFAAGPLPAMAPLLRAGQVRALAVTTRRRAPGWAQVPTLAEAGLDGFADEFWSGIFAPLGIDATWARQVADALRAAAAEPPVQAIVEASGLQLDTGEALTSFAEDVRASREQAARLVRRLGLRWGQT